MGEVCGTAPRRTFYKSTTTWHKHHEQKKFIQNQRQIHIQSIAPALNPTRSPTYAATCQLAERRGLLLKFDSSTFQQFTIILHLRAQSSSFLVVAASLIIRPTIVINRFSSLPNDGHVLVGHIYLIAVSQTTQLQ